MSVPAPFPIPDPDDPDGGPPDPEPYALSAQPMAEGRRVRCQRALGHDPYGPTEGYCGGTMAARPGLDDDAEPPSFFRQGED